MRKFITIVAGIAVLTTFIPVSLAHAATVPALTQGAMFTVGSKTVQVDGQSYTMDVAPYVDANGRTQVPVRYLGEVLGMTAQWDTQKQQVILTKQGFPATEALVIGSNALNWTYRGSYGTSTMDTIPVIVPPGRTMLPARFVAQAMGYKVTWNGANQTVTVAPWS